MCDGLLCVWRTVMRVVDCDSRGGLWCVRWTVVRVVDCCACSGLWRV